MPLTKLQSFLLLCRRSKLKFYSNSSANAVVDCEHNHQTEFVSIVQSFEKRRLQSDTLINAIDSVLCESSYGLSLALSIFRWASKQRNFRHTADTYVHMIVKLGMHGNDIQEMEVLLKEMVRFEITGVGKAFELLIDLFCRNGKTVEALRVFEHSVAAKQRLSVVTCNTLLGAIVNPQDGNIQSVLFVYKEMVKIGILPDVQTLNCLIKSLCNAGRLDLAIKQFHKMDKKCCEPNNQTFEIVISALCSNGSIDYAVKVLNQMLVLGCPDCQFCHNMIALFCSINRYQEATTLCKMMKDKGLKLDQSLYAIVIQCLCRNNQVGVAVQLFDDMTSSTLTPASAIYVDIVDGYCNIGKLEEAASFIKRGNILEVKPYNCLLKAYCKRNMLLQAITYLNEMSCYGSIDNLSWNIVIRGHCEVGRVAKALEILGQMIVSSYMVDEATFSAIVIGFCRTGAYENALGLFRHSHLQKLYLDPQSCSELLEGLCYMKKIDEATKLFLSVGSKGCSITSHSLDMLVEGICQNGKLDKALNVRSIAVSNGTTCLLTTYKTILIQLMTLGRDKDILVFLSQILVEGCYLDAITYCAFIHGLCKKSIRREAALIFNQMVDRGLLPNSETLELLLATLAKFSQLHMIVSRLAKVMNVKLFSPSTCNMIIYGLIKEGQKHEASNILDNMLEMGWVPDVETHGLLLQSINAEEEDRKDDAYEAVDGDQVSHILDEALGSLNKQIAEE